jgi:hypothetical protein
MREEMLVHLEGHFQSWYHEYGSVEAGGRGEMKGMEWELKRTRGVET